ncbi:hypothetical protein FH972_026122 [Carpinus fangiana]|uniref:AB hydrolase-1 domain-containing protein n=1 Tax=Carpinus fangiana TaxID=176857 RepID=A0A5N6L3E5_9ROSI|nr:hypothetical protein FH972_026122 [Carpinus fangiana]KAB8648465.1 hypothetical protein FH972_026122 [Carpinus fangiana]
MLLDLGLQVVAPDLMGFGGTDAPHVQPDSGHLSTYSLKRASDDIAALASLLHVDRFILGGHDWGGAVVYRVALWHPERVTGIFSVCTPYNAPSKTFVSLDQVVQRAPQFGYQKHLAGPEVEAEIKGKVQLRRFLNGMYGARTATKESLFDPKIGINFRVLPELGKSKLLTDEEMVYYVDEYDRHGMHGTLNWVSHRPLRLSPALLSS